MRELTLQLPDDMLKRLQSAADSQHVRVVELVQSAIENYLEGEEEPTNEEILDDLREAMRDALTGKTHPARAMLDEIRKDLARDADNRSQP